METFRAMSESGVLVPVLMVLGAVAIVAVIQWRKYHQSAAEAALRQQVLYLKQQMVERGMSADEIGQVLAAGGRPSDRPALHETADYKG